MAHLRYFGQVILVLSCVKTSFGQTLNELVETFEMMFLLHGLFHDLIVPTSPVGYLRPGSESPFIKNRGSCSLRFLFG